MKKYWDEVTVYKGMLTKGVPDTRIIISVSFMICPRIKKDIGVRSGNQYLVDMEGNRAVEKSVSPKEMPQGIETNCLSSSVLPFLSRGSWVLFLFSSCGPCPSTTLPFTTSK